jgi:hypothetical protein
MEFSLSSSDVGDFGMNTPAYFALDYLNGIAFPDGADLDHNGIPDDQEVGLDVDLDDDGTPDLFQSTMKCVNSATGNGQIGIGIEGSPNIEGIVEMAAVDPDSISDSVNKPENLPLGLISFKLAVENHGDTVEITAYLSEGLGPNAKWYKYDETLGWHEYPYADFSGDGRSVKLTLTDGGDGDADRIVNGYISDPGGVGTSAPSLSSGSRGGGVGGCFIRTLLPQTW